MKLKLARNGWILLLPLIFTACAHHHAHMADKAREGIEATNRQLEAAIAEGSGEAAAACYTEDGQLLPPGSPVVTGHEAIAAFWQAGVDSGIGGVTLTTLEVEGHRKTATEVGAFEIRDGEGNAIGEGSFVVLWKKTDGGWKLHRDIWNSNAVP